MAEDTEYKSPEEIKGIELRVYGTSPHGPTERRIFVWTENGWFERIEGSSGNVAFSPIADSEDDLRQLLAVENPSADFVELKGEIRKTVLEEFSEQSIDYRDTPLYSEQEDVDEDEEQEYHQHGL
jgi:hypothetical protein